MNTLSTYLFECLYFLESEELYLLEIKRNDLNEYAAVAEKFQWLRIEKANLEIAKLSFRAMDSSKEVEERFFEEGFLKFTTATGTYIEKYNSAQHSLINNSQQEIPAAVLDSVYSMLQKK
ncbi:MAG: hypothetical protein EOO42_11195 [Flavobacteriales bacterium]|nr:MAG: hypothetical protein EOO42_11195 [Flavobacteriales bacterium]